MIKREILLDFTSLLDVTLIVLFFFVLFSSFEGRENKEKTDEKIKEYNSAIEIAKEREREAEALSQRLEEEIAIVNTSDESRAYDISEILEFKNSRNLKILLDMKEQGWIIRVIHEGKIVATMEKRDTIGTDLLNALQSAGFNEAQTIFCEFVFDGAIPGTASAYRSIIKGLSEVSYQYKGLYISETDLSIGD